MRLAAGLLLASLALPQAPQAVAPSPAPADDTSSALELIARIEAAWAAKDLPVWLALRDTGDPELRREEEELARDRFSAEQSELRVARPLVVAAGRTRLVLGADLFTVTEPRGRLEQWRLVLEKRDGAWRLVGRDVVSDIDGLIHLSLDTRAYRADGLSLRFEDFELRLASGSLFLSPATLGPTALVFVGKGNLRITPRPEAERQQLRQFCGSPELVDGVSAAFVRVHPADLARVLGEQELRPDPEGASRLPTAQRLFREQGSRAFVLDTTAPRSPWWLYPALGDSTITLETGKRGTLTFTVSGSEPEGISLFDRARRRQLCLYPRAGHPTRYSEDDNRAADILHHDLQLRFEPSRDLIEGQDTLRIRTLAASTTLRLRLDDALRVESVSSAEAGRHVFFRVRGQDTLMVSLGTLAGRVGELALTVRFAGTLPPGTIEHEALQEPSRDVQTRPGLSEDEIPIETIAVYSNRTPWYPQGGTDDYATADLRLDVPAGYTAVTGGRRIGTRTEAGRSVVEYRQERPGRYVSVAVGRLVDLGTRVEAPVPIHAFATQRTRADTEATARQASGILRFLEAQFGPAPYPELGLVVAEARAPGGHSPPGMIYLQQRPPLLRGILRDDPASFWDVPGFFLAHELAHQWWGHGVAPQNYRERWLSEAVAHYAAALYVREAQGEEAFQDVLKRMSRWALRETDEGPIRLGFRLGHIRGEPQVFRAVVYDKGALVLHMLRTLVGDDAFHAALRELQTAHRFEKVGTDDLREALERASGRPLSAYFDAWADGVSLPTLHVAYGNSAGHVTVTVRAQDLPGPVPLELTLVHSQGRETRRVTLETGGGTWTFPVSAPVKRVEANSDRGLLARVERD